MKHKDLPFVCHDCALIFVKLSIHRCDRILYKGAIGPLEYTSHPELLLSDHKPVRGLFLAEGRQIDPEKHHTALQKVLRTLDTLENDAMPDVSVSTSEVSFEGVNYLSTGKKMLTITNTSSVVVEWSFIPKFGESEFCKGWLRVFPTTGILPPGEKCDVELSLRLDPSTAAMANLGTPEICDDILVLHLDRGKDYFISISSTTVRSFMCTTIDDLVYLTKPASVVPVGPIVRPTVDPTDGSVPMHVPKEAWLIVDHLLRCRAGESDLFIQPGTVDGVQEVVQRLDTGVPLDEDVSIHSVADVLVKWLMALPEPIIPFSIYKQCIDARKSYASCKQIVNGLATAHQYMFLYVTSLLRDHLHFCAEAGHQAKPDEFALLFGSCLLRQPPRGNSAADEARMVSNDIAGLKKQAEFVLHFIVNTDTTEL